MPKVPEHLLFTEQMFWNYFLAMDIISGYEAEYNEEKIIFDELHTEKE